MSERHTDRERRDAPPGAVERFALRARLLVAEQGKLLAVALAVLGIVALTVAAVTEEGHRQTVATALNTSAVAAGDTSLYESGERLHDAPVYVRAATDTVTLREHATVPEGEVDVEQRLVLRLEAVRDGEVFWTDSSPLAKRNATVTDGDASVAAALNVSAVAERMATVRREIGGAGRVRASVVSVVGYDTGRYEGTLRHVADLSVTDRAFWLSGDLAADRTHATPVVAERSTAGSRDALLPGLAGAALLLGATGAWWYASRDPDVERIEREVQHARNSEWISRGELPVWGDREAIRIDSLQELVDLGIDTNSRVIEDPRVGAYGVIGDDIIYYYSENGSWEALPHVAFGFGDDAMGSVDTEWVNTPEFDAPEPAQPDGGETEWEWLDPED